MKSDKTYYVYILASKRSGTVYIGITNSLMNRGLEHRTHKDMDSFTAKYNVTRLVYYETHASPGEAIAREKELKRFRRVWKIELIEKDNPTWRDLFEDMD